MKRISGLVLSCALLVTKYNPLSELAVQAEFAVVAGLCSLLVKQNLHKGQNVAVVFVFPCTCGLHAELIFLHFQLFYLPGR